MGLTLKDKKIEPMNILIDFFAFQYDMVYDFMKFLMKPILALKGKKSLLDILVDFFASLYDMVHSFVIFLIEYVKWISDLRPNNSADFNTPANELIQIQNQNPFDIR